MPTFRVAHVSREGNNLIIVPLAADFEFKTGEEQNAIMAELQHQANAAGLAGTVVPIWPGPSGGFRFRARHEWHPFFSSLTPHEIEAALNKDISW